MAGFKKVMLTEKNNSITQKIADNDFDAQDKLGDVEFENNYSAKKLNELYNEFDSISIDEMTANKVEVTPVAVTKTSVKTKIYLTAGAFIALLLLFLVIYNFVVINSLNGGIKLLQDEVAYQEYQVASKVDKLDDLTNQLTIEQELVNNGYGNISSDNIITVEIPSSSNVNSLTGESNWFDKFCDFISSVFGG